MSRVTVAAVKFLENAVQNGLKNGSSFSGDEIINYNGEDVRVSIEIRVRKPEVNVTFPDITDNELEEFPITTKRSSKKQKEQLEKEAVIKLPKIRKVRRGKT